MIKLNVHGQLHNIAHNTRSQLSAISLNDRTSQ